MNLPEFSIDKKVTIIMVIMGIVLLGLIGLSRLPMELFPPISFPQISVVTEYANAAPEEIETLITKPLEEAVGSVSGLRKMVSVSREGKSIINLSFGWGTDINFGALAVREKIDLVKERLPKEAEDPVVLKFDPLARPIMILSLTGDMSPSDLKFIAEKTLKDNLEKVEGVASASISGGLDREILVEVNQGRLLAANTSILEVTDALEKTNLSYPAGSIKKGLYEYLIRTIGEFRSVDEVGLTVVKSHTVSDFKRRESEFLERERYGRRDTIRDAREEGRKEQLLKRLIFLEDVANIRDTFKEKTSISRYSGEENVSISIQKQAGANTIRVVDAVSEALLLLREELESRGVTLNVIYDHSIFIRRSISGLRDNAIQGGVLAFIVLLFFLRNFLSAFIVTLAIPISIIGVFFLMYVRGISLNIMSLGGLALGIGMLVDNGIVVIENIFRLSEKGKSGRDAAIDGTNEVCWPVISSTLTTVAVFFPLIIFVPGVAGQLFKDLSWTVIFALAMSLFISLTLTPLLASNIKIKNKRNAKKDIASKEYDFEKKFKAMSAGKQNFTCWKIIGFALLLFLLAIFIFSKLDQEVLPKVDQGQFIVKVDMPVGQRLEATDAVVSAVENEILQLPTVENTAVSIGSAGGEEGAGIETLRASQGQILVNLKEDRDVTSDQVVDKLKERINKLDTGNAEITYVVAESEFAFAAGGGAPIVVEVKGYDLDTLRAMADEVMAVIKDIPRTYNVVDDMSKPSPENKVDIDRKKAALYGISSRDISLTAKAAIEGAVPTKFKEGGTEIDIRVRLREEDREDIGSLQNMLVRSPMLDAEIPLKEVAEIVSGFGPGEIKRKDQQRTVTVTANIEEGANKKQIIEKAIIKLNPLAEKLPEGYAIKMAGESREVQESFQKIMFALILSIVLVYMIMASQFESFVQPFIIMFTVPLSIIGVSVALWITGTSLNVISLLGIIMLGGIVVNNGIVLIEYINVARASGVDLVTASINASKIRARPIFMSALTSVVGLLPLALGFGEGAELRAPLARSVMGGLLSSTGLTLVVLPAIYILVARGLERFYGPPEEAEAPAA